MKIQWMEEGAPDHIFFSRAKMMEHQLNESVNYVVHIGKWQKQMMVKQTDLIGELSIGLSSQLELPFDLPDLSYELVVNGQEIQFGPVIGMVLTGHKFTEKRLKRLAPYFKQYQKVNGLVYLCYWEDFDWDTKTVKGLYYNPSNDFESHWNEGTFPFPDAIYLRKKPPKNLRKTVSKAFDGKIFNSYMFDKWEFHCAMLVSDQTKPYVLPTYQYKNPALFKEILNLIPKVYLKPQNGSLGKGIYMIEKKEDTYEISFENGQMQVAKEGGLNKFCRHMLPSKKYLIQEAAHASYGRKRVDFRVIMQKNERSEWNCTGILGRFSQPDCIITNDAPTHVSGLEALQTFFHFKPDEAAKKQDELIEVCKKVCMQIEAAFGVYGDLGLDVIIDDQQRIWVLEANKFHEHNFIEEIDEELYEKTVGMPLLYAKALAGFHSDSLRD
ncbi:YheC/YheD family endospore coat-associated protein [Neobacillus dielmonensis]|uniref:YheC/YheD family endospore coat-associated protein n=1 Tax=Neobacillus dielmonensis TaxID=1347369 RepID=UPI000AE84E9C|nr:YheC/YheD family protein [Neobacillus dielmonensis]